MPQTHTLFAGLAAVAAVCASALATAGVGSADPAVSPVPGVPIDIVQAPGIPAMQQLSPVLQQAAANPQNAASLLMAAANAFTGNSTAPDNSRQVAASVNQFLQMPNQSPPAPTGSAADMIPLTHEPPPGAAPGAELHLPPGVNPANAVGPAPEITLAPARGAAPDSAPAPPPAPRPATNPSPPPGFGADTPPTQEFLYPSIGNGCLADGGNSIATVISVAGPATIPKPGPQKGQTAYVFTAVGTSAPANEQRLPLSVTWVNLTTGKSGTATLTPNPEINPNGPTTLVAIADTGSGNILSTIFGQVTTADKQCTFMPTLGTTVVP